MLITPDRPTSYEAFALETAKDTLRELIEVFSLTTATDSQDTSRRDFNINRVYSALAQLKRIEL